MKEIIKTSKGRFVVMEVSDWGLTKKQLYELEFPIIEKIGFIHNITEEEASNIIGASELILDFNNGKPKYLKRLESLYCIFKSQGIEITNNTYIFKV